MNEVISPSPDGLIMLMMRYRIKLVVMLPDGTDCTYWYRDTLPEAKELRDELRTDLAECDCRLYIYADTRHGHIRVS